MICQFASMVRASWLAIAVCGVLVVCACVATAEPSASGELVRPDLCLAAVNPAAEPDPFGGSIRSVDVVIVGPVNPPALGVQMFLEFDTSVLDFVDIEPTGDRFTYELFEVVDEAAGTIDYAIGVDPPVGGPAVTGDETVARIRFRAHGADACAVGAVRFRLPHNPPTMLGGVDGSMILPRCHGGLACVTDLDCDHGVTCRAGYCDIDAGMDCSAGPCEAEIILDGGPAVLTCPYEDGTVLDVGSDCGSTMANIEWAPVVGIDFQDGELAAECTALYHLPCHDDGDCAAVSSTCVDGFCAQGIVRNDLGLDGGEFPMGRTVVTCESAPDSCGNVADPCTFEIINSGMNRLAVDLETSPTLVAGPLGRCFRFEVNDCRGDAAITRFAEQAVELGMPYNPPGHGTAIVEVPPGNWDCLSVRDVLHSLESSCLLECVADYTIQDPQTGDVIPLGDVWAASFKGSPGVTESCHWLINGDLNGDGVIDILDYTIWNGLNGFVDGHNDCAFRVPCTSNSECEDAFAAMGITNLVMPRCEALGPFSDDGLCTGFHADINGDGVVNPLDFTFIVINFFDTDKAGCLDICDPGARARGDDGGRRGRQAISVDELAAAGLGAFADAADVNGDRMVDIKDVALVLNGAADMSPVGRESNRSK